MHITAVKGMNDIRPAATDAFLDSSLWAVIFARATDVLNSFGFAPVWLPIVEDTALFARGIGEDTDIVSKEMYTFTDRGERSMTLRPEGTAGAVRAYIEHGLGRNDTVQRWWYAGPMFRAERPQKGRYRQFYQIGAELFGAATAAADAEMVMTGYQLCKALGLADIKVRINTLGDAPSRQAYRVALQGYLRAHRGELCESCQGRIETNPLRVLDCKRDSCRSIIAGAPDIADSMTAEATGHFEQVQALLGSVPFSRDPRLVRGLDYYTGLIFEFTTGALGAQDAVLGGGRYDNFVQDLGGPATPAIGFAAGVERLALLMAQSQTVATRRGPHLYIAPMDASCMAFAFELAASVRAASGARQVEVDVSGGRLKAQMRRADRIGADWVLVLGLNELQTKRGKLKNLRASNEVDVALQVDTLVKELSHI